MVSDKSMNKGSVEDVAVEIIPLPVPPKFNPGLFLRVKSFFCMIFLFSTAYFGSIFMQCSLIPLAFFSHATFKRYIDSSIYIWFKLAEFLLVCILGVRVRHFGDEFVPNGSGQSANFLFLLNHRTRLDWLYTWLLGEQLQSTKIVLKSVLGAIPGAGWAMNFASFIFLERKLAKDSARIKQALDYLYRKGNKIEVLIFPEGTDLDKPAVQRNRAYSLKTGKAVTQYTLHPRVTGTMLMLECLLPEKKIKYVYDVTVAYPYQFPTKESHILLGCVPKEVHFLVRRYRLEEIPFETNSDGQCVVGEMTSKWLEEIWLDKELVLQNYYGLAPENRKFNSAELPLKYCAYDWATNCISSESKLIFLYWVLFQAWVIYILLTSYWIFYYFILCNCFCLYIWYAKRGGIAAWIAELAGHPIEQYDIGCNQDKN